jgi:hypothetical protein
MSHVGLRPVDVAYFDVTPLVPPLDRIVPGGRGAGRDRPETTISRGPFRTLGTAYMVAAVRDLAPAFSGPG